MSSNARPPAIVSWTLRLENAAALDAPVQAIEPTIRAVFGTGTRASVLRGDWLGHAVHPLLTDLVIGTWTSATLLDLFGGRESSIPAQRLIGTGLLAVGPTAWSGWAEWSAAGVTAVVCGDDLYAYGVMRACRALGIVIPDDLSLVGFNDLPYSELAAPPLTSVNLFATKLGAEAARLLQRYMRTGKPPRSRQLETSLVIRESTAAAPRSARRVARP